MRGRQLGRGAAVVQQAGGPLVAQLALDRGQRLVDGVPDQRVDEPEGMVGAQDLGAGQGRDAGGSPVLVELGVGGHVAQLAAVAEHGHRAGDAGAVVRQPPEPDQHQA